MPIDDHTRKAEEALRTNEHMLRSMIRYGKDIMTMIGPDGKVKYRSPSYGFILGYTAEEMEAMSIFETVHPDDIEGMKENMKTLMTHPGQTFNISWRQRHKSGGYRWMEGMGTNLLNEPDINALVCNFRDITDHVIIQQNLENKNTELSRLFNSIDEVIYSTTRNPYLLTQWSEACMKIYGYSSQEFLERQRLWYDVILPEDRYVIDQLNEVLQTGAAARCQYRIRHRDGSIRWIEANVTPTLDSQRGIITRIDGVNRDITEKKQAEEDRLQSERKFRALIENSKDVIILTDSDRKMLYVSPAITQVLGYAPEELMGIDPISLMHPDEVADNVALRARINEGGAVSKVLRMRHMDGTWRWVDMTLANQLRDPAINATVANFRDVTDKKLIEEALLNSEKRFRTLIEKSKEIITITDAGRLIKYMSPSLTEILGYEVEELIGSEIQALYHPDDREAMRELIASLIYEQVNFITHTLRVRHKDGSWKWLEVAVTNQLDNPDINGLLGNLRDITDRKNAEDALLRNEQKFRALIENNKDGIALTDMNRTFIYLSPSVRNILGYEQNELIGQNAEALYHPDDWPKMDEMVQSVIADKKIVGAELIRIRHKDGEWRWVEITASNQFDDPAVNAMVANFRDVTERKMADEALMMSEQRFKSLIEKNQDVITLSSAEGFITYMSPSIKELLDYDPEELLGTPAMGLMHPDELENNIGHLIWCNENPGKSMFMTLRLHHKDGSWRWVEATSTSQLHNPAVNAIVSNLRDITARKKAQDELELLNQSLEEKVQERTMQLAESNRALESFSSLAAHDLQAPLRILSGYSSMISHDYADKLGEEGAALLAVIRKQTGHMSQLVSDLLTFSRASHTIMKEEKVNLDLMVNELADELCLLSSNGKTPDIRIAELGSVSCDAHLMKQVWTNLISNALKYSGKKEKPQVEIGRIKGEGENIYYVRDNGAGFDSKHQHKLFQVFQRLHSSSDFEGTGVGLALVKNVVARHGGRVWAESELGKGATFYFSMPD